MACTGKGCGQFVDGKDLFGGNLPGSLQEDTTEQQCLQLCLQTGGCNGFSWLGSGASGNCYLKNVAADAAFTDRPGSTAYLLCSDQGLSSGTNLSFFFSAKPNSCCFAGYRHLLGYAHLLTRVLCTVPTLNINPSFFGATAVATGTGSIFSDATV